MNSYSTAYPPDGSVADITPGTALEGFRFETDLTPTRAAKKRKIFEKNTSEGFLLVYFKQYFRIFLMFSTSNRPYHLSTTSTGPNKTYYFATVMLDVLNAHSRNKPFVKIL
ncbi:hypothetical protein GcM1_250041 [Golovinomyces cichoracearum]|uniref:Uncharacterized protein n=1 Tax=Golovinomyces cichoracearum TaxID=62708 RepID=A0A420IAS1_9PEZI|nr:hypothetical protein GcM1_250041 [Golovinomyces cichoracearum]